MEFTNLTIMNTLCDYRGICAKASMLTLLMQENTEYACFERNALKKEYCNLVFMKGIMNGRAERTLKRIQARAIKRILNCMCEIDALKSTPDNNTADDIPADA